MMLDVFTLHIAFFSLLVLWIFCSLIAWVLYMYDKRKSIQSSRRISEKTLLLWSVVGSLGALLGIYLHHHKSAHIYFLLVAWESLFLQIMILYEVY